MATSATGAIRRSARPRNGGIFMVGTTNQVGGADFAPAVGLPDLTSRGVTFEQYETPKTVNFIAQFGPARGAWFKDPAGNVLGLRQGPVPAGG